MGKRGNKSVLQTCLLADEEGYTKWEGNKFNEKDFQGGGPLVDE